jgi:hypothetical protein
MSMAPPVIRAHSEVSVRQAPPLPAHVLVLPWNMRVTCMCLCPYARGSIHTDDDDDGILLRRRRITQVLYHNHTTTISRLG